MQRTQIRTYLFVCTCLKSKKGIPLSMGGPGAWGLGPPHFPLKLRRAIYITFELQVWIAGRTPVLTSRRLFFSFFFSFFLC